jgi:hypothetical protein
MFTFLARYYDRPIANARRSVERLTYDDKTNKRLNEPGVNKDAVIINFARETGIEPDLMIIVDYFNSVEACIDAEACDRTVACSELKSEAQALMYTFSPVFQKWKVDWGSDPLQKITKFVDRCENGTG